MAQGGGKLSFLSLTGSLDLFQKGLFKGQYKRYWFWFDEQTCCLKYYKNQQTYSHSVREPLGVIDLRYAKVTPGLTSGNKASNVFQISVDNQVYLLATKDNNAAINWIEKLQEKRSEFIKATSARHEANLEGEKRKTLSLLNKPVGALAGNSTQESAEESCSVRKIFNAKFQGDEASRLGMSLGLEPMQQSAGNIRGHVDGSRRATLAYSPVGETAEVCTSDPPAAEDSDTVDDSQQAVLQPHERAQLALEACYLESQNKASKLQKELLHVREQLVSREREVQELNKELASVKEELMMRKAPRSDLQMENENLKNIIEQYKRSVKSLDDEIELHKLNQAAHDKLILTEKQKSVDLEKELNFIKSRYVRLLSEQFKITVPSGGAVDASEEAEESRYSKQLLELLKKEGGGHSLFEAYCQPFEDHYGDHYEWQGDTATQHYLCRLLDAHYNHQEQEKLMLDWEEFLSQCKPTRGNKDLLQLTGDKQKLKHLLRRGVPLELRSHVWSSLVHLSVGKIKEVRDRASAGSATYYQSLLQNGASSSSIKQIKLDLYRTLPGNRHFKSGGSGADKLERVLLAYSLHNDKVGYCQGMNMIAAMGLFFLDEETTFWFLVMVIEKLMPPGYYTPGLLAAQADIAVVQKLVPEKLPQINAHLQEYFIDVTLVTFNWFLTIFIDALPTESALRILDCFLLEGHKILFRVALAILKVNEAHILSTSDPVALFQFLKQVARHAFDMDQLFHAAFVQLNPFPRRKELVSWHQVGFHSAKEQWMKREKQRLESEKQQQPEQTLHLLSSIATGSTTPTARHLLWECGCLRGTNEVWVCCDEKGKGKVGVIHLDEGSTPRLELTLCKVHSRVITVYHESSSDLLLLGTLDFVLQAIDCKRREVVWSHKFKDSILDIVGTESGKIIVGLADGNIAMLKHVDKTSWDDDPWHLHIGSSSVVTMVMSCEEAVWCGAGKTIMVVSTETLEPVYSLLLSGKVNKMQCGVHGVWVSFRSSTKLCLYDTLSYLNLLEIDYTSLSPTPLVDNTSKSGVLSANFRVTSLLAEGDFLYIGSGCGELLQFTVVAGVSDPEASIREFVAAKVKPRGRSKRRPGDEPPSPTARGGLLTKALLGEEKELIDLEHPVSESYYANRHRRTQFGRTLRRGRSEVGGVGADHLSVYRLEPLSRKLLGSSINEPVRVLLPIGDRILMCLNKVGEWDKCVAVLRSTQSEVWMVEYVPSPRQPSPRQHSSYHHGN